MFAYMMRFELGHQLRRPYPWIAMAISGSLGFGVAYIMSRGGQNPSDLDRITDFLASFTVFEMLLTISIFADVALRDRAARMEEIASTLPIRPSVYFGGRLLAACVVACMVMAGALAGYFALLLVGGAAPRTEQPQFLNYVALLLCFVVPNICVTGAIIFATTKRAGGQTVAYLTAIGLIALMLVGASLAQLSAYAALLDPFGDSLLRTDFKSLLSIQSLFVWNRILWIALASIAFALACAMPNAGSRRPKNDDSQTQRCPAPQYRRPVLNVSGAAGAWSQLATCVSQEVGAILRGWTFCSFLVLGIGLPFATLALQLALEKIPREPASFVIASWMATGVWFFLLFLPLVYSGQLVWQNRRARIADIIDATPTPSWVFVLSKIASLASLIVIFNGVAIVVSVAFQAAYGSENISLGYYVIMLMFENGIPTLTCGVIAIFLHTLINRRAIAMLLFFSIMIAAPFFVQHQLLKFWTLSVIPMGPPRVSTSALIQALWCAFYWLSISALLGAMTCLLWIRGMEPFKSRLAHVEQAASRPVLLVGAVALCSALAAAGGMYWFDVI
jgi:ABC-2 type transport system permease protein